MGENHIEKLLTLGDLCINLGYQRVRIIGRQTHHRWTAIYVGNRFPRGVNMSLKIIFLCVLLIAPSLVLADNHVYLDVVKTGEDKGADTIFVGMNYEARIFIRNDTHLGEIRIAPRFWGGIVGKDDGSKAGHFWEWLDVGGYGSTTGCVRVIPGCRMDPPATVWDSLFTIFEWNMNEDSPDTLGIHGVADAVGMAPGGSQHMISIHFTPKMPSYGMVMMWADTAYVSPTGGLTFYDMAGTPIYPAYSSPGEWPIAIVCGDGNSDGQINLADAVYLINYVFKGGSAPGPLQAGDANCDDAVNLADAVYLINYVFKGGPAPCCP